MLRKGLIFRALTKQVRSRKKFNNLRRAVL